MKRWICLVFLVFLFLMAACGKTEAPSQPENPAEPAAPAEPMLPPEQAPPDEPLPPAEEKSYNILFVGNSSTFYNDMPTKIFEKMAKAAGHDVDVVTLTNESHTLEKFADVNDQFGAMLEKTLKGTKKYDYIILQDLTRRPTANPIMFYTPAIELVERIRETGAQPVFYATIARQTGHEALTQDGLTNETMTWKSAAAYQVLGEKLDVPVAHCGLAFYDVNTGTDGIEIYDRDLAHPSYEGSYLIGATIYAKIFGEDPTKLTFTGRLSQENAAILLEAARKAVFEDLPIPEAYLTNAQATLSRVLP